ncbi:MAG TPA: LytTR family DNA-binding domain-containing protein [Polyangiaceae bacterium]|nr:LytTR family DNA-binding domain-containing protein [Polyangiaceae bacterium]
MKALTALLVDDERLARRELRTLLDAHGSVEIVGEASSVREAVRRLETVTPDVVFLDVQMPRQSGFELLERVENSFRVVFVTAYDAYALRAFEVNALDYLLKPVHPDRLARTLGRLLAPAPPDAEPPEPARAEAATPAADEGARPLGADDHLFLSFDKRSRFVRVRSIACLCGAGDYSEVVLEDGQRALVSRTLRQWEERLPERSFVRIHRATIVNLDFVERVERNDDESYLVFLRGLAEPLAMSRRQAARVKLRFV